MALYSFQGDVELIGNLFHRCSNRDLTQNLRLLPIESVGTSSNSGHGYDSCPDEPFLGLSQEADGLEAIS
jgi:hypothetical protein